jgi:serine/threonine protein kinase
VSGSEDDKTIVLGGVAGGSRIFPPATPDGTPNCLPINTRLGEFEILSLVGAGGFGIVYLAYDHSLERKVALKEYMPASLASRTQDLHVSVRSERHRETFEVGPAALGNEARLLAKFDNPALVKVYRFWEEKGSAYMAMPFYDGVTLRDALKQRAEAPTKAGSAGFSSR